MFSQLISKLRNWNSPYKMRNWGLPLPDENRSPDDGEEIVSFLRSQGNIPNNQEVWCRTKISKLVQSTGRRKIKYHTYFASCILAAAFSIFFLLFAIYYDNSILFVIGALFAVLAPIFWLSSNSISYNENPVNYKDCLSDDLSDIQKKSVSSAIDLIISDKSSLAWMGIYNDLFSIPSQAFDAENAFLLLTGIVKDRKAIWLKGDKPTGKIVYYKNPKVISRNTRQYDIQKSNLANAKLAKKLHYTISKNLNANSKLNAGKKARLDAIAFASKNPKFWDSIRSDIDLLDSDMFESHKSDLIIIFSEAARPKSTLAEKPGTKMMYDFVSLEDRTLETWLRKLKVPVID